MIGGFHSICLCEAENVGLDAIESMLPEGDRVRILANRIRNENYLDPDATVGVWDAVSRRFNEQARDAGISSEFPDFVANIISRAMHAGYGEEDVAALVKALHKP
jgi:hypothetical protein